MDTVLQGRDSITFDDLNKLGYVEQVFKESLRLYPPASGTTRMNLQEVIVDGFRIPKHTTLMVGLYKLLHAKNRVRKKLFENAKDVLSTI